jgi:hypothetical protein
MRVLSCILVRARKGIRAVLVLPLIVAQLFVGLALGGITNVAAVPPCGTNGVLTTLGSTATCTYTLTGEDTFTVPAGVSSLHIVAIGGKGGDGGSGDNLQFGWVSQPGGVGGAGALITADIPATSGTIRYIEVAASGVTGGSGTVSGGAGGAGSFYGGGSGGAGAAPSMSTGGGGGGGGESDVRSCSTAGPPLCPALTAAAGDPRLVVAGGGGGGGGSGNAFLFPGPDFGGSGGVAGDSTVTGSGKGGDAACCFGFAGANGGVGAGAGGGGSTFCVPNVPGDPGLPGAGGNGSTDSCGAGGGGGGSGFDGGGGGGAGANISGGGGGGGGSSFGPTGSTVVTDTTGTPKVTITYIATSPTATVTTPTSTGIFLGDSNTDGVTVTGNATLGSPSGTVSFFACGPSASSCPTGGVPVGSATLTPNVNNTATATSPAFTPSASGKWCFRGEYSGGPGYSASSDGSASECFTVIVNDLSATGREIAAVERDSFTQTVATFTDPGGSEPPGAFTATIDWGDGATSTGTLSRSADGYTVTGGHTYTDEGKFAIEVEITEADGESLAPTATADSEATVAEHDSLTAHAVTGLRAKENVLFSGTVATFSDTIAGTASDFTATIDWGDGKTSQATSIVLVGGSYRVIGSHKYLDEQATPLPISVTIRDGAPGTATATTASTITVTENDILSAKGKTIRAPHGHLFSGKVATFTNTHANVAGDFTATIQWGDGTTSSGTVGVSGKGLAVSGAHNYAQAGTFTVSISIVDDPPGTAAATATSSAHVF